MIMNTIRTKCGACGVLNSASIEGFSVTNRSWGQVLAQCVDCGVGNLIFVRSIKIVATRIEGNQHIPINQIIGNSKGDLTKELKVLKQYPERDVKIPEGLPEKVQQVFHEAERAFEGKIWGAAAMQFRKALEQACKDKGQSSGKLYNKIEGLEQNGLITADLKDWAHEIRIIGNEAAHDDPLPEEEAKKEAEDIRVFSDLFMTYVYTLPQKLNERRNPSS